MLVSNMLMICEAILSGILASSVAANSDDTILPDAISTRRSRFASESTALKWPVLSRVISNIRAGLSLPSTIVVCNHSSSPSSLVLTRTALSVRSCSNARATLSVLMNLSASSSSTPKRNSNALKVSPRRMVSSRTKCCSLSSMAAICSSSLGSGSSWIIFLTGKSAASGANGATAAAPIAHTAKNKAEIDTARETRLDPKSCLLPEAK